MNSPEVKQWCEAEIEAGEKLVVVDLDGCTGMDSTFMGNMAGLAMKVMKRQGGALQVAGASDACKSSLEDLGLTALLQINPEGAVWEPMTEQIRQSLMQVSQSAPEDKTEHVYETHKTLVDADIRNKEKFSTVLSCLEAELAAKKSNS